MTVDFAAPPVERSLSLRGDAATCRALLDDELERAAGRPTRLIVDLDDVPTVDSVVLGALVLALKRLERDGGRLELASRRPEVSRLLRMTGLERILPLTPPR